MEFRAQKAQLDHMLDWVEGEATRAHLNQRAVREVRLACEEALVNVIDHAYQGQANRTLDIECARDEHELKVTIRDRGAAFDPRSVPEPDTGATLDERRVGGLGVFMVRHLVDDLNYQRMGDQNILTLLKKG
jgi:anti-sigma regulatory factor (Ser/Thr protein kinase)